MELTGASATRVQQKLRYVTLLLEQWRNSLSEPRSDYDRQAITDAYRESVIHLLLDAYHAFILEIACSLGLQRDFDQQGYQRSNGEMITLNSVGDCLKKQGRASPEVTLLMQLAMDETSWLSQLIVAGHSVFELNSALLQRPKALGKNQIETVSISQSPGQLELAQCEAIAQSLQEQVQASREASQEW